MQPTIFIETTTKDGKPISVRLGDVFVMKSEFAAIKSDVDISNYLILSLLAVAVTPAALYMPPSRIYFSMIGVDKLRYSISKRTENGLIILDRGKEIELNEKYMIRAAKALSGNRGSGIVGGLELYMRTIVTSPAKMKMMSMHKLPTRLIDLSKWPRMSLRQWAIYHLGLKHVPTVNHIDNRTDMINSMIKLSVSARRSDNPRGRPPGMSVRGVATGRIRVHNIVGRSNGGRFGKIHGVPIVNLISNEIKFPRGLGDRVEVCPHSDVSIRNIGPYMIICVDNKPEWVLLDGDIRPQGHIEWSFHDGHRITMPIKRFDEELLEWLVVAHDGRDNAEESVEEVVIKYTDPYAYSNDLNHSVANNAGGIYHNIAPEPGVDINLPILKTIGDDLWPAEPVALEDHKIKQYHNGDGQVYESMKHKAIEDSEEEV